MLKLAVLRQIAYAHSIRRFIRTVLEKLIPGRWIKRVFAESDEDFDARLDAVFKLMDVATATKDDYRKAVVGVLCDEVSRLCEVLKAVCEGSGYGEYFEAHISHERFVRLVLSTDSVKLGKMKRVVADESLSPIDLLRGIGAVLNDEALEERVALCASERRRANAELKAIAADVKSAMQNGLAEIRSDVAAVGERVDAVDAKVSKLRGSGKRRGRYTKEARAACWNCWVTAANREEVWRSVNTRITYKSVHAYYEALLAKIGVKDGNQFRSIVRAEARYRNRELSARRDAARQRGKSAAKPNGKTRQNNKSPLKNERMKGQSLLIQ